MQLDTRKIYYVYEWYNIDTGEIFYVGKGRGHRCRDKAPADRNKPFIEYISNNNCNYRKIAEKLDEATACELEDKRIKELKEKGECKSNLISRTTHRGICYGKDNGFFGKKHSKEIIEYVRKLNKDGRHKGENNSQYGISPKQRMTPEKYNVWLKNLSLASNGTRNSQYGVSVKERMKDDLGYEKFCKSCARGSGSENPNAKAVRMWNDKISKTFKCIKDCSQYLFDNGFTTNKKAASNISTAIKANKKYLEFYFEKI